MNYNSLLFVVFGVGIFVAFSLIGYCGELYKKQKKNESKNIIVHNVEEFDFENIDKGNDIKNNNQLIEQDINNNNDELLDEYDSNIQL